MVELEESLKELSTLDILIARVKSMEKSEAVNSSSHFKQVIFVL